MGMIKYGDGVLERHIEVDSNGQARGCILQPTRELILNRNAELRKNPGAIKPLSGIGMLEATIPLEDWHDLQAKYPDLAASDNETQQTAFTKFLNSREADIYRVA